MKDSGSRALLLRWLKTAHEKMTRGEDLDNFDLLTVESIIGLLLEGYDPRIELGIEVKRGKPRLVNLANRAVAYDYWSQRELPGPNGDKPLEKAVASDVAKKFGLTIPGVRAIAKRHEERTRAAAKIFGWNGCVMAARLFAGELDGGIS